MESDREKSEFNMAVSWLNRLNLEFYICNDAAKNLDAHAWFSSLMILNRELTTEMKPNEEDSQDKESWEIFDEINRLTTMQTRTGQRGIPPKLYKRLHEYEKFIRNIMNKSGLLKKVQEDLYGTDEEW